MERRLSYPKMNRTGVEEIGILISLITTAIVLIPRSVTRETWSSTSHSAVVPLLVQAHVDFTHMPTLDFKVTAALVALVLSHQVSKSTVPFADVWVVRAFKSELYCMSGLYLN